MASPDEIEELKRRLRRGRAPVAEPPPEFEARARQAEAARLGIPAWMLPAAPPRPPTVATPALLTKLRGETPPLGFPAWMLAAQPPPLPPTERVGEAKFPREQMTPEQRYELLRIRSGFQLPKEMPREMPRQQPLGLPLREIGGSLAAFAEIAGPRVLQVLTAGAMDPLNQLDYVNPESERIVGAMFRGDITPAEAGDQLQRIFNKRPLSEQLLLGGLGDPLNLFPGVGFMPAGAVTGGVRAAGRLGRAGVTALREAGEAAARGAKPVLREQAGFVRLKEGGFAAQPEDIFYMRKGETAPTAAPSTTEAQVKLFEDEAAGNAVVFGDEPTRDQVRAAAAKLGIQEDEAHVSVLGEAVPEREARLAELRAEAAALQAMDSPVRPPWAVGHTNEEVIAFARRWNLNPYLKDWWDATGRDDIRGFRMGEFKGVAGKSKTARLAEIRDEIADLTAPAPVVPPPQIGVVQAGMGIGEAPPQGALFEGLRGEAQLAPLADEAAILARQARAAEVAKGQVVLPDVPPAAAPSPTGPAAIRAEFDALLDSVGDAKKAALPGIQKRLSELLDEAVAAEEPTVAARAAPPVAPAAAVPSPAAAVEELAGKRLTHVSGLGAGQQEFEGMYLSTEAANRYTAVGRKLSEATVTITNPRVFDSPAEYNAFRERYLPKGVGLEDATEAQLRAAARDATEALKAQGFDAAYLRESETAEGILVVFDRSKVSLSNTRPITKAVLAQERAIGRAAAAPPAAPAAPAPVPAAVPPVPPVTPPPAIPPVAAAGGVPPGGVKGLATVEAMWKERPEPVRWWRGLGLKLQERLNDRFFGLREMATRVHRITPIASGGERDLINMITRAPGAVPAAITRTRLIALNMARVAPGVDTSDVNTIAFAQHGKNILVEKGAKRVLAGGFRDPAELDGVLAALRAKLGDEGYAAAERAAQVLQGVYQEERRRLTGYGIISQELSDVLEQRYPWYNPTQYLEHIDQEAAQGRQVPPFSNTASGLRRLSEIGLETAEQEPLVTLAEQLIRNEVRIQRNELAKAIVKLGIEDGLPITKAKADIFPIAKELGGEETLFRALPRAGLNQLAFFENGVMQVYDVPEWMYREAEVLSRIVPNPITSFVGSLNGISRAAFTSFSPEFVVANWLNDSLTAFIHRGILPTDTGRRLLLSVKGLERDPVMQAFRLAGGYQARFFGRSAQELAREVGLSGGVIGQSPASIRRVILDAIPRAGEAGEQAPRLALFERELNKNLPGWRRMTPEQVAATPQARKAAADAVELTINFARGGYLIKHANPFIIFLNASMEGTKLPFRALREHPNARWRLAGVGAGLTGLTAYNLSYPEYHDVPNTIRWGSVVVMLPSKEKDAAGNPKPNYLTIIPRTREWGAFIAPLTYAMERMFSDSPTDFGTLSKTLAPQLLPFMDFPAPEVIQELFEQMANYDLYWTEPVVPSELQAVPNREQVMPWTSRTMQEVGSRVGLSPIRLQHAVSGIGGGAARAATSVSDYIIQQLRPPPGDERSRALLAKYEALETSVERRAMLQALTTGEREALMSLLRQPERGFPIISPIGRRLMPGRGGQLWRTGQAIAERETGINAAQTREVSKRLTSLTDALLSEQQRLDTAFQNKTMTGDVWRKERGRLGVEYQGALRLLGLEFPAAAQVQQDPEAARRYYEAVATLGGAVEDRRTRGQVLLAGWYAIQPEEVASGVLDWDTFYGQRDAYRKTLSTEDRASLDAELRSRMTPTEKEYEKDMAALEPYWRIERDLIKAAGVVVEYEQYKALPKLERPAYLRLAKVNPRIERLRKWINNAALARKVERDTNEDTRSKLAKWGFAAETPAEIIAREEQRQLVGAGAP